MTTRATVAATFLALCTCSSTTGGTGGGSGGGLGTGGGSAAGGGSGGGTGGGAGGGPAGGAGGGTAGGAGGGSAGGAGGGTAGGAGGGSAGGSGGGSASTCPTASHLAADGGCESIFTGWFATSSFNTGRDHHVTFTGATSDGGMLFVAGGVSTTAALSDVQGARINADGTLGAFSHVADLPKALLGQGLAQTGPNTVVIAGGLRADSNSVGDAAVGQVSPNGTLTFTVANALTDPRYHVTLSEHGGFIYAIGGLNQSVTGPTPVQTVSKTIERATFDGTTLGPWSKIDDLPAPLSHHAAVVVGDSLYLIGGLSSNSALTQILKATFLTDGKLSAFTQVGALPGARATSAGFYFLGQLYILAGSSQAASNPTDTFERAPIAADGTVGTFEQLGSLPLTRQHSHQVPRVGSYFYSAGGSSSAPQNDVFVGQLL